MFNPFIQVWHKKQNKETRFYQQKWSDTIIIKPVFLSANNIERWACSAELSENNRRNGHTLSAALHICTSGFQNFHNSVHKVIRCLGVQMCLWKKERVCVVDFCDFFSQFVCGKNDTYTEKVKFKKEVSEGRLDENLWRRWVWR